MSRKVKITLFYWWKSNVVCNSALKNWALSETACWSHLGSKEKHEDLINTKKQCFYSRYKGYTFCFVWFGFVLFLVFIECLTCFKLWIWQRDKNDDKKGNKTMKQCKDKMMNILHASWIGETQRANQHYGVTTPW